MKTVTNVILTLSLTVLSTCGNMDSNFTGPSESVVGCTKKVSIIEIKQFKKPKFRLGFSYGEPIDTLDFEKRLEELAQSTQQKR